MNKRNIIIWIITLIFLPSCQARQEMPVYQETKLIVAQDTSENGAQAANTLFCRHLDREIFYQSLDTPRRYASTGSTRAGVIPHHDAAASLISGFFNMAAAQARDGAYDTVIIIAPNHDGDLGDIIYSTLDWYHSGLIQSDLDIISAVAALDIPETSIIENSRRMEEDHSASILVPYVQRYLPDTEVAAILVSRTLSLDGLLSFALSLEKIIMESEKNILLVCSVDFSHYLTPAEAFINDEVTLAAIQNFDYEQIHGLSNEYLDSPASLILFLHYLDSLGLAPAVLDHTDASEFMGTALPETTSYFVLAGDA